MSRVGHFRHQTHMQPGQSHHLAMGEWRDLDFFCAGPADWVASPLDPRLFQSTAFPELVWNGLLSD